MMVVKQPRFLKDCLPAPSLGSGSGFEAADWDVDPGFELELWGFARGSGLGRRGWGRAAADYDVDGWLRASLGPDRLASGCQVVFRTKCYYLSN